MLKCQKYQGKLSKFDFETLNIDDLVFSAVTTLYFGWKFLLLLLFPILLPKIHEIRSFQALNWQNLTVTDQCVRDFSRI